MNKWAVILLLFIIAAFAVFFFTRKPSTSGIAGDMKHNDDGSIVFKGVRYRSDWGNTLTVEGYLRIKDRHYDENMPIVTYDLIITSGDFSDPEEVEIRPKGGGTYIWRSRKRNPEGMLVAYHTVPAGPEAQEKMDDMDEGIEIRLTGRLSRNGEIRGDDGRYLRLGHKSHKFILVEDVLHK
jgi:hypothetical protein